MRYEFYDDRAGWVLSGLITVSCRGIRWGLRRYGHPLSYAMRTVNVVACDANTNPFGNAAHEGIRIFVGLFRNSEDPNIIAAGILLELVKITGQFINLDFVDLDGLLSFC